MGSSGAAPSRRLVDLTHPVEAGMRTHPGLPAPSTGVYLSRAQSEAVYAQGTRFEIGSISMVGNTGTYLDAPWHRFEGGTDLAGLSLEQTAALDGVVIDVPAGCERGIGTDLVDAAEVSGRAVLLHTGWDRHWRTERYGIGAPFLTAAAAESLAGRSAVLVGIDSVNVDDIEGSGGGHRPAHTVLLGAGIPVLEHLTGLAALPREGFILHAAPVPIRHFGTFPVRAYAVLDADDVPDRRADGT